MLGQTPLKAKSARKSARCLAVFPPRYDLLNGLMTLGLHRNWRKQTARSLDLSPTPGRFLDLATGTGDLALAVAQAYQKVHIENADLAIHAVDISQNMLLEAQRKINQTHMIKHIHLEKAAMESLPFDNQSFHGITVGFGIRNAADRQKAIREAFRVLKPAGVFCILEAVPPESTWQRWLQQLHLKITVPLMGSLISEGQAYRYLGNSVGNFPSPKDFKQDLLDAGFCQVQFRVLHLGGSTLFIAQRA